MASAWGSSFGLAWGNAWGSLNVPAITRRERRKAPGRFYCLQPCPVHHQLAARRYYAFTPMPIRFQSGPRRRYLIKG